MALADALPLLFPWMEREIGKYVPIRRPHSNDMFLLNDASPFAMIEVRGQPFETAEDLEIVARCHRLNASYKQVAMDGLIFYIWETRSPLDIDAAYPRHSFDEPTAQWIDDTYAAHLGGGLLNANRKFIGVQLREAHLIMGEALGGHISNMRASEADPDPARIAALERIMDLLIEELRDYHPRRLGVRFEEFDGRAGFRVTYSELAEALVLAATGIWRKVPLTTGPLGESMFREVPVFEGDTVRFIEPGAPWYGAALSFKHFPASTFPGMFGKLARTAYANTACHSFRCVSTEVAKSIMSHKGWKIAAADDPAIDQQGSLRQAAAAIGAADYVLGDYAFVALVFHPDPVELGRCANSAWGALADGGATTSREHTLSIEAAWMSIFPGNAAKRPRPGYVHSRNFAAMAPLHSYNTGRRIGDWGKPVLVFRTTSGEPFYYHIRNGGLANTFFCGMSGSGKTTLLGAIIALSGRCGVKTNIVYDKDYGLKVLIRSLGQTYIELGGALLAPLKRLSHTDAPFLARLIRAAIMRDGRGELSSEDDRRLPIALEAVMALPPPERWLSEIAGMLGEAPGAAGERLRKWCWGNEYGWVFDAPEDKVRMTDRIIAFDQTTILDDPYARGPTIAILHYYTTLLTDGRRILETFDELNKSMAESEFSPIINDALRVIRKLGGGTNLATQSPHDITTNAALGHVIREQVASMFMGANPNGQWIDYGTEGGFGCSRREFEIIKALPLGGGPFLLKQGSTSQVLQMPLPEPVAALISGWEEHTRLFDRIAAEEEQDIAATLRRWQIERIKEEKVAA